MNIVDIQAKKILDSKNHPTIEATIILEDGQTFTAASPSGASTGTTEAVELPVETALNNISTIIKPALVEKDAILHTHPRSKAAIAYKRIAAKITGVDYKEPNLLSRMLGR